jgi:transketolase
MGITVACGMALTDKNRDVYCLISDGEWFEGSVQESLNFIKENNLTNIKLYCNFNGYSAYSKTDVSFVTDITLKYCPWAKIYNNDLKNYPFLIGLNAHYKAISDNEWKELNETRI